MNASAPAWGVRKGKANTKQQEPPPRRPVHAGRRCYVWSVRCNPSAWGIETHARNRYHSGGAFTVMHNDPHGRRTWL